LHFLPSEKTNALFLQKLKDYQKYHLLIRPKFKSETKQQLESAGL